MLSIAICDDEKNIGAELESVLIEILVKLNVKHEIDVFFDGKELCKKLETQTHFDLIFLDIEFAKDEMSGIEVGRLIRDTHKNNMVSIVYISWEKKYAMELFDIRPLHFHVKPLSHDKVEKVVRTYLEISGLWSGVLSYRVGYDTFKVPLKDVLYLENYERKVILYLADGKKKEFYGSLKEVYEEQLKKFDFLFIHASYVVNYDFIAIVEYSQLFLADTELPLPISKHRRNEVRENYFAITKRRRV